jgi:hypothetical protein
VISVVVLGLKATALTLDSRAGRRLGRLEAGEGSGAIGLHIAGQAPFQHQAQVRTLAGLVADYFDLIRDRTHRSRAAVERWPDVGGDGARQRQARERVRREHGARWPGPATWTPLRCRAVAARYAGASQSMDAHQTCRYK